MKQLHRYLIYYPVKRYIDKHLTGLSKKKGNETLFMYIDHTGLVTLYQLNMYTNHYTISVILVCMILNGERAMLYNGYEGYTLKVVIFVNKQVEKHSVGYLL